MNSIKISKFVNVNSPKMLKTTKLCKHIYANLFNHGRSARGRNLIQNTWLELLESEEKEYFKKRRDLYLNYVKNELSSGRNIDDLITEVQLQQQQHSDHVSTMHDRIQQEDCYVTRNKEFITHVAAEVRNGRPVEEVLAESKTILQRDRELRDRNFVVKS